ncbi:MAG: general secretion pathway protein GspL [Giesbergeria sp.]|jgi:general secretion pathway protein L|nr:general secretion pathway protein GspL [Giesbergeria sp.]MBP6160160.1 general secretion pathway protein GspL [Giesbergeria sp.]MBP7084181.1 general secretion pathway protein GspL [Giesbergeria sp.]MBP9894262.1 general secretion pathway protein GspL [Giesbergeria sp.]
MSILVLTLPLATGAPAPEYSYVLSQDGHQPTRHGHASAALLPASGRAAGELVALVPAQALSWQRVQLPPGVALNSPRMRAVLEGLLEDQVLDEPARLHFALAPDAAAGASAWVAVCDRAWLRGALQALEAAGRPVARVVPEIAPGASPPALHFTGTAEAPLVLATGLPPEGAVAVLPLAPAALALLPAQAQDDEPITATSESAVASLAEQTLGRPVALVSASERALQAARGRWELAQFDLASSGRTRAMRKAGGLLGALLQAPQWRAARWAGAVLVLAQVVGLNAWAWQERSALTTKQAAVKSTLTTAFPQVKVVVDPPLQMERELALLRQASGALAPADLEPMLAAAGSTLATQGSASAIDYSPGALQLRGLALSAEAQATAGNALQAQTYQLSSENDSLWLRLAGQP